MKRACARSVSSIFASDLGRAWSKRNVESRARDTSLPGTRRREKREGNRKRAAATAAAAAAAAVAVSSRREASKADERRSRNPEWPPRPLSRLLTDRQESARERKRETAIGRGVRREEGASTQRRRKV